MSADVTEPFLMSAPVISFAATAPVLIPMTSATTARTIVGIFIRDHCMVPPKR